MFQAGCADLRLVWCHAASRPYDGFEATVLVRSSVFHTAPHNIRRASSPTALLRRRAPHNSIRSQSAQLLASKSFCAAPQRTPTQSCSTPTHFNIPPSYPWPSCFWPPRNVPAEDAHHAPDLLVSANDWVQPCCHCCQICAVLCQGLKVGITTGTVNLLVLWAQQHTMHEEDVRSGRLAHVGVTLRQREDVCSVC